MKISTEDKAELLKLVAEKEASGMTWDNIADKMNMFSNRHDGESTWRKRASRIMQEATDDIEDCDDEYQSKLLAIKKQIVMDRDERNQTNAYIRRLAREDSIKEIASDFADKMNDKKILDVNYNYTPNGDKEAILQISDWHFGMECDNYWNKYNPEIAKERIRALLFKVIERCEDNNVKTIRVVNLSDLIAGRIHTQIRIESRYDVITQTMMVSEILAEFLNALATRFDVEYYDCTDNHSRIEPNKKESLQLETLSRIIHWYLKSRNMNARVHINENSFGDDIVSFDVFGHHIIGCHGDKDRPTSIVANLSLVTKQHYDLILSGHFHHLSVEEKNESIVVCNGTLMGTDEYASNLRLNSKPSQNLIICTEGDPLWCLYKIKLN